MTIAELLLQDFDFEIDNTRRTLQRVPEGRNDWAPHPKSMHLGKLAMHCATLPFFAMCVVEDESMDMAVPRRERPSMEFTTAAAAEEALQKTAAEARKAIAGASDEQLSAIWPFTWGETVLSRDSRHKTIRQVCMNHLVHHTAQLGVYLRMLDLPVPALYGPSADEEWAAQ